jgi:hypothetical protein
MLNDVALPPRFDVVVEPPGAAGGTAIAPAPVGLVEPVAEPVADVVTGAGVVVAVVVAPAATVADDPVPVLPVVLVSVLVALLATAVVVRLGSGVAGAVSVVVDCWSVEGVRLDELSDEVGSTDEGASRPSRNSTSRRRTYGRRRAGRRGRSSRITASLLTTGTEGCVGRTPSAAADAHH